MRIFKNTWFTRFADKEGITDDELREAVNRLEMGQAEADLGSGVYKMRVARPGESKSGGYRIIVFFRSEELTFFVYGYAKSRRSNIDQKELRGFKSDARDLLSYTDDQIRIRLRTKTLMEIF